MSQTARTLTFVGVALVSVASAAVLHVTTRPASLAEYSDEGEQFYPEFQDPNEATALRVAAYNDETAQVDVFNVEFRNGDWRIPSHHDYPADGETRLARTATSVIGIRRGALVSTTEEDHKRLGLLDPLDETITGTEGRGDRITLNKGQNVLADFIIGSRVEGQENVYHVRRADEDRSYRAELNIDISTKFADWIEQDLLAVRRGDLREIEIDRYHIDETVGQIVPGEISTLSRDTSTGPWELDDLDEQAEEVDTTAVNQIINALEDLKIVGVRPKPPGLSADLKAASGLQMDTLTFLDLQSKGFFIAGGGLVSNEGEVRVGTSDGVRYALRFGEVFTGTEVELEVGKPAGAGGDDAGESAAGETASGNESASSEGEEPEGNDSDDADGSEGNESDADDSDADASGTDESDSDEDTSLTRSRYAFITAHFDEGLIEGPPEPPVKPEKPEGASGDDASSGAQADEQTSTSSDADAESTTDAEPDGSTSDAEPDGETSDAQPAADAAEETPEAETDAENAETPDPQKEYEKALAQYEQDLKQYEQDKQAYDEKLKEGRERADELNARFADWYYVITAKAFDDIRVSRDQLVKAKEPEEPQETSDAPDAPSETSDAPAEGAAPSADAPGPPSSPAPETPAAADDAPSEPETPEPAQPSADTPSGDSADAAGTPSPGETSAPDTPSAGSGPAPEAPEPSESGEPQPSEAPADSPPEPSEAPSQSPPSEDEGGSDGERR